jgi:hypothetical protein
VRAHIGDHIIVASPATGGVTRDGTGVGVRGADGSPPYMVQWRGSTNVVLYFPGADAHVDQIHATGAASSARPVEAPHVRSWRVNIDLFETGDDTSAHAVLVAESPTRLDARGKAHRNPADKSVPEIGDEVAVARALRLLSDRLLEAASTDIAGIAGHAEPIAT